ncbi:hypothetical protein LXL04_021629 [Taraxacum kok-saghyz]
MAGPLDRYHKLGLQQSFSRTYHYPSACKELAIILKLSYSKFPKSLQSLVFQDVVTAFGLLPRMQTPTAIHAANTLLQAVESALPKQKKAMAVTEFKHAMVTHKRHSKSQQNKEDLVELPQDVLVHVFSFLDLQSLLSSSQVCRSWNIASSDTHLWQTLYTNTTHIFHNINNPIYHKLTNNIFSQKSNIHWKNIYIEMYNGFSWKKLLTSSRGICKHCHEIVWVSDMTNDKTFELKCKYHHILPISTRQIVEYIGGGYVLSDSDSDSDTDTDSCDGYASKLWAYPRRSEFSH